MYCSDCMVCDEDTVFCSCVYDRVVCNVLKGKHAVEAKVEKTEGTGFKPVIQ